MQEKITKFKKLIDSSKQIALFSHIRMDPDTFGSSSALYYILKKMGKKVIILNDEPTPKEFEFLGVNHLITVGGNLEKFKPDLIISLDAASTEQLGESYVKNKKIINNTNFIIIDHHITNPGFGTLNIIDTHSSSTCELLFELLDQIDLTKHIDPKIATLLITGILTDTNVFYNTNVTSKTHDITGKLLDLGANSRKPIFEFFKKKSINKTKLLGFALSNMQIIENKLYNGKNIVSTVLNKQDFNNLNVTDRDTNGIIEHLINIENTEIAIIIYPLPNGTTKASFRSHTYNVSELAQKLGGGGHKQAAGCSSANSPEKFLEKIIGQI